MFTVLQNAMEKIADKIPIGLFFYNFPHENIAPDDNRREKFFKVN